MGFIAHSLPFLSMNLKICCFLSILKSQLTNFFAFGFLLFVVRFLCMSESHCNTSHLLLMSLVTLRSGDSSKIFLRKAPHNPPYISALDGFSPMTDILVRRPSWKSCVYPTILCGRVAYIFRWSHKPVHAEVEARDLCWGVFSNFSPLYFLWE